MPHAYAVAVLRYKDYAAAAIPVLPVRRGIEVTKKHVTGYILSFVIAAIMLTFAGYTGYMYLAVTAVTGLFLLYTTWAGHKKNDDSVWAGRLYVSSILTITLLCVMMSIDS